MKQIIIEFDDDMDNKHALWYCVQACRDDIVSVYDKILIKKEKLTDNYGNSIRKFTVRKNEIDYGEPI
jgi:hypothetical protein